MNDKPVKKTMLKVPISKDMANKMKKEAIDNKKKSASDEIGKKIFQNIKPAKKNG